MARVLAFGQIDFEAATATGICTVASLASVDTLAVTFVIAASNVGRVSLVWTSGVTATSDLIPEDDVPGVRLRWLTVVRETAAPSLVITKGA